MNQSGLQKWNRLGYKNSKNRYPKNGLTSVECILDMFPKNIQNRKCISLYNHRTYSLVYRYKAHEAGHGIPRGRPHILIISGTTFTSVAQQPLRPQNLLFEIAPFWQI